MKMNERTLANARLFQDGTPVVVRKRCGNETSCQLFLMCRKIIPQPGHVGGRDPSAAGEITTMRKLPEIVYTTVRRLEPVGDDLIRMHLSLENGGAWEDRGTLVVPHRRLIANATFVVSAVQDFFGPTADSSAIMERLRLH